MDIQVRFPVEEIGFYTPPASEIERAFQYLQKYGEVYGDHMSIVMLVFAGF